MSDGIELRPCPFCGDDEADILSYKNAGRWFYVHCTDCGANGPGCYDEEGAAAFWNDRAYDDGRRAI